MVVSNNAAIRLRVLYVCPLAHGGGHPAYAASIETEALASAGHQVTLLTFAGMVSGATKPHVRNMSVIEEEGSLSRLLRSMNKDARLGPISRSIAFIATVTVACLVAKNEKYDLIQLRDGNPVFMVLPQLLGLMISNQSWLISLLVRGDERSVIGRIASSINFPIIFKKSMEANRYLFTCQNERLTRFYSEEFDGGILASRVELLKPPIVAPLESQMTSEEAKKTLGLPLNNPIFLSFGAIHPGKDMTTVTKVFQTHREWTLAHAGATNGQIEHALFAEPNFVVRDEFVGERLKQLYFKAACALILSYKAEFSGSASMLLEACRYRTPVIASRVGELGQIVEERNIGLLFQPGDAKGLTDAIQQYVSLSESELESLRKNCDSVSRDNSVSNWLTRCAVLYSKLEEQSQSVVSS